MAMTYDTFNALVKERDFQAAIDQLESQGSVLPIAENYHELVVHAYWEQKDLPFVVKIAPAGLAFCISRGQHTVDQALREQLLGIAKRIAYDLASFTWPGWNEPGIAPTDADVDVGRGAALLNLDLAIKLNRPANRIRDAHWLLGAHLLWAKDTASALAEFQQAIPPDLAADDPKRLLMEGYCFMAATFAGKPEAGAGWDKLIASLTSRNTPGDVFTLSQLKTAFAVLHPRLQTAEVSDQPAAPAPGE